MLPLETPNSALLQLEAGLSHAVIVVLFLLAALAARDASSALPGRLLTGLCLCLGLLHIAGLSIAEAWLPPTAILFLRIAGLPNVGLFWWFCLSVLQDDFRLRPWHWGGLALFSLPATLSLFPSLAGLVRLGDGAKALVETIPFWALVHIGWQAAQGLRIDLVEQRRRARIGLIFALLVAASVSLVAENLADPILGSVIRNAFSLVVTLGVLMWLVSLRAEQMLFADEASVEDPQHTIAPRDLALYESLIGAMDNDELYLEHRLTISQLAEPLGVAEHQLRALINQGLGYRNFSSFLNGYRLQRAKELLADPSRARDTILRVALDSGFASLQTFNRSFKDNEGIPPSAYRQQALAAQLAERGAPRDP